MKTHLFVLSLYKTRCPQLTQRIGSPLFSWTLEAQSPQVYWTGLSKGVSLMPDMAWFEEDIFRVLSYARSRLTCRRNSFKLETVVGLKTLEIGRCLMAVWCGRNNKELLILV